MQQHYQTAARPLRGSKIRTRPVSQIVEVAQARTGNRGFPALIWTATAAICGAVSSAPSASARTQVLPFTAPLPAAFPSDRGRTGAAVVVGQRIAILGAPGDSVRGPDAGSVQLFDRDGVTGAYTLGQRLVPPGVGAFDRFGSAVSSSGDLLVVGAKGDDDAAPNAGAAYVFRRPGVGQPFYFVDKLIPNAGGISDCFGVAVHVLGNRIAVGAPRADIAAFEGGAVYTYTFDFSTDSVVLDDVVTRQGALSGENFGTSVAVFGGQLLVGATRLDQPQGPANVGGVVAFEEDAVGAWSQNQLLFANQPVANSRFGSALAFEPPRPGTSGTLVVGASDASLPGQPVARGSVTIFERSTASAWQEVFTHGPEGVEPGSRLGESLVLQGDVVLAGAPGRERDTGAVDVLRRISGSWSLAGEIQVPGSVEGDVVGTGVGYANQFPVVGAPGREVEGVDSAGWAWSSSALWAHAGEVHCAPANPNSTGESAALSATGSASVLNLDFTLEAGFLPAGTFGFSIISRSTSVVPAPGGSDGTLCLGGTIGRFSQNLVQADPSGRMGITLDLLNLPSPLAPAVVAGDLWWFQVWYRDSNPTATSNFTNAIGVTFL